MRLLSAYFAARVALLALQVALRSDVMRQLPAAGIAYPLILPGLALIIQAHSRLFTEALPAGLKSECD